MAKILQRDSLPLGGFSGLKEHRLVVDTRVGWSADGAWNGIGNFVYLADARFLPHGETRMHPHREIDVISLMVEGRIDHEGSLEHGSSLPTDHVQVQRAGGEGFKHNEINPDDAENRMIQLWVLPEYAGAKAGFHSYVLEQGKMIRIYGGAQNNGATFDSHTCMEMGMLNPDQQIAYQGEVMLYITRGEAMVGDVMLYDGDLLRGVDVRLQAKTLLQVIVIYEE